MNPYTDVQLVVHRCTIFFPSLLLLHKSIKQKIHIFVITYKKKNKK